MKISPSFLYRCLNFYSACSFARRRNLRLQEFLLFQKHHGVTLIFVSELARLSRFASSKLCAISLNAFKHATEALQQQRSDEFIQK